MADTDNHDTEEFGFAQEMALEHGARYLDDDAEMFVITAKDLYTLMLALGYKHNTEHK